MADDMARQLRSMEATEDAALQKDLAELAKPPTAKLADAAAGLHRLLDIAKHNGLCVLANNGQDKEWIEVENIAVRHR
jgi:hypothetical protein